MRRSAVINPVERTDDPWTLFIGWCVLVILPPSLGIFLTVREKRQYRIASSNFMEDYERFRTPSRSLSDGAIEVGLRANVLLGTTIFLFMLAICFIATVALILNTTADSYAGRQARWHSFRALVTTHTVVCFSVATLTGSSQMRV